MSAKITFYFRPGCHLCDDMWQHLMEIREESPFDIEAVDIDQNLFAPQTGVRMIP